MKPYPATIGSCKGDCQQDGRNCKTQALCQMAVANPQPTAATKCWIACQPIQTKPGGLTVHRGIPDMAIVYVESEPLGWKWKVAIAAIATALIVYAAVSSWAIYLAWPL